MLNPTQSNKKIKTGARKGDLPTVLCTGSRKTMCREDPDSAFTVTDTATYAHEKLYTGF
jgi:hypothetical protein